MTSEWVGVSLGSLLDIKHGFAFKSEYFSETPTNHQLVTPGNFAIGGGFQFGKGKFYSGPVPQEYVLKEGQVVVTMTDLSKAADTLGYAAVVPKTEKTTWLHNQRVGLLIFKNEDLLYPAFAHYLMRSPEYRSHVIAGATGSTVKHTAPTRIYEYRFNLPTLAEQICIGETLSALDNRITLLRETNKTLEAIAQAIFKSWFIDFEPVRAKMEGRAPAGMTEETSALFSDELIDSELGMVPKGWSVHGLDKIATYLNGLALQKYPPTGNDDLPVIKIAQLRKGDTIGADKASRAIKPEFIVKDGDVLFSWSGSLEVEIWCGGEGALNQHLFKVTSEKFSKWFYFLWTRKHLEHFRQVAASKATTMGHIQRSHLSDAKVVVPSGQLLQVADGLFQPIIDRITSNAMQVGTLAAIRDALLPRLISGKLRITDSRPEAQT